MHCMCVSARSDTLTKLLLSTKCSQHYRNSFYYPLCFVIVAICVIGNKMDLSAQREVSRERGEEFAHQIGAMYTETSAAENTGE